MACVLFGQLGVTASAQTLVVDSQGARTRVRTAAVLEVAGGTATQRDNLVFVDALPGAQLVLAAPSGWELRIQDGPGDLIVEARTGPTHIVDAAGNLTVTDPALLRVEDSGGDVVIVQTDPARIADVRIADGTGAITVQSLRGRLRIDDQGGDMRLTNFAGELRIDDGSGHIVGSRWRGRAVIDDGSGDIDIDDAERVVIQDDGTGSRRFEQTQAIYP